MSFKDTLLALSIYPDSTPEYAIDQAISIAKGLSAEITSLMPAVDRSQIARSYARGTWLIDPSVLIDETMAKCTQASRRLGDRFAMQTKSQGVAGKTVIERTDPYPGPELIVQHARLHDLTFLPVPELIGLDELFHETVIFGSGRPVMLIPAKAGGATTSGAIDDVVVLWDFSRAAARALADAMPILSKARNVRIVTFLNEKRFDRTVNFDDLRRHLDIHAVNAAFEAIDVAGRSIGDAIRATIEAPTNLLVMGAFGHSRMIEFVLGGATRSLLANPPIPVFMSH